MVNTSTSADNGKKGCFFMGLRPYPPVINGRINMIKFIEASTDLVAVVEHFGPLFAPLKYDMQGNVDKIKKHFTYDENSCLLELMLAETGREKLGSGSVLWLNRAVLFFDLVCTQVLSQVRDNKNIDVDMRRVFTVAYEGSVKKYHNWATYMTCTFVCKKSPTLPDFIKLFEMENNLKEFRTKAETLHTALHLVRCKIDEFFKENNNIF